MIHKPFKELLGEKYADEVFDRGVEKKEWVIARDGFIKGFEKAANYMIIQSYSMKGLMEIDELQKKLMS